MESAPISEAALAGLVSGSVVALLLTVGWFHYEYCYAAVADAADDPVALVTTAAAQIVVKDSDHPLGNP